MGYIGQPVTVCIPCPYDFTDVETVAVTGDRWNPCGHMLLRTGPKYFHVDVVYGYPLTMSHEGFQRFLRESRKKEIRRTRVSLPRPDKAAAKLEEVLSTKWLWKVLPDNCARFAEVVLQAGGTGEGLWSNCPALEPWHTRMASPLRRGP